jgi:hypothetical protein
VLPSSVEEMRDGVLLASLDEPEVPDVPAKADRCDLPGLEELS